MQKSFFILLGFLCIVAVITAGCTATKDMGSVKIPTTVSGKGPAIFTFTSLGGSHSFYVTSIGDHAEMIVTVTGTKRDADGKIKSADIIHDAMAPGGIDAGKTLSGFIPDTYTIEVMTTNDGAPWRIQIA